MTNPHKGDVAFSVGDKTYTLRYSHLSLVKLERALDKGLMQIMREMGSAENMRLGTIIALMWAGLQKHHPDMSEEDVAMLLDDMDGGATAAMSHIDDAFARAFNAPGTKGTNPRQANGSGAGTTPSSSTQATATIPISSGT